MLLSNCCNFARFFYRHDKKMRTIRLFIVFCLTALSGMAAIHNEKAEDFDFCEANADGMMLYYRFVEQDYCELVAGPEKYTGVVHLTSSSCHPK